MKNVINFYGFTYTHSDEVSNRVLINFIIPVSPVILYVFIKIMLLEKLFGESFMPGMINIISIMISFLLGIVWLIKYKNSLKGVFLYDAYLQIDRHLYSPYYISIINPKIRYDEIKSCEINPRKSENYKQWNDKQLHYLGGSGDSYIRLETIHDKVYCFCIENQEDFVDEINKRINQE